jgi:hypothetical protein
LGIRGQPLPEALKLRLRWITLKLESAVPQD